MRASTIPVLKACRALVMLLLAALLAALLTAPALAQLPVPAQGNHIAAELVAEAPARPGEPLTLALHFTPQPGWHGYWSNPGDAGYGMRLAWNLPAGWQVGEPLYPVPQQLVIAGLMNHVYEGDYAVLVPVTVPAGQAGGGMQPIEVKADWLACTDKICVPESATLTLRVALGEGPRDTRFDSWRAALPPLLDTPARFELSGDRLRIALPLPSTVRLADPHVFLSETQLVDYGAVQTFMQEGNWLVAELPREGLAQDVGQVSGILKLDNARNGVTFTAQPGSVPQGGVPLGNAASELAPLWVLLGGALLGGLFLNLMPCVFPILSLKALTLARAGESEAGARREGVAYTAGVVLACVSLGALLLVLRSAGSEVGWAFQLQEPGVVALLLVIAVAITANFAGVFDLPGMSFTRSGGRASAFATGLLAAFVATPCTGPFMAAALGAALLLPWAQALLLFATLGLGLALPFLALGFVPGLRRVIPKPGRWMETFRRLLAVPMGLTALALLWLAWRLGGMEFAALALLVAILVVAVLSLRSRSKPLARGALLAGAVAAFALPSVYAPATAREGESLLGPVPYSNRALLDITGSQGKPVFLWFTADWCLTCKVNEGVAIERATTRDAFEAAGVVAMRGDWTRRDPEITRFLTEHGAAGVPLYLWYPAGGGEPKVLPQVLTPDLLSDLAKAS